DVGVVALALPHHRDLLHQAQLAQRVERLVDGGARQGRQRGAHPGVQHLRRRAVLRLEQPPVARHAVRRHVPPALAAAGDEVTHVAFQAGGRAVHRAWRNILHQEPSVKARLRPGLCQAPAAASASLAAGAARAHRCSVIANVLPACSPAATWSAAPWASAIPFTIARPSPAPCPLSRWPCQKRSNRCGSCSAGIPGPVSDTEMRTLPPSSSARSSTRPPDGTNLSALSIR